MSVEHGRGHHGPEDTIPVWAKRPEVYILKSASEASGLSVELIRRAVRAGDLRVSNPRVAGRPISKFVIDADELRRWLLDQP
ncbi:hypothetical protein [Demequina sp.]|uniref:hypothetical protein n=1 Tax=Demequina sp. TaxID=2050685 RepID=UPI003A8A35B2